MLPSQGPPIQKKSIFIFYWFISRVEILEVFILFSKIIFPRKIFIVRRMPGQARQADFFDGFRKFVATALQSFDLYFQPHPKVNGELFDWRRGGGALK